MYCKDWSRIFVGQQKSPEMWIDSLPITNTFCIPLHRLMCHRALSFGPYAARTSLYPRKKQSICDSSASLLERILFPMQ